MPSSHIELDGRPYNIYPDRYRQVVANPMAAKTSQGSSKYNDQQNWDYFVQENWSGGIGKNSVDLTGQWFSVGDSRLSNQFSVIAPMVDISGSLNTSQELVSVNKYFREHASLYQEITVGQDTGSDYEQVVAVASFAMEDTEHYVVELKCKTPSSDITVVAVLYSWNGTSPTGSILDSDTFTIYSSNLPGYQNVSAKLTLDPGVATGNGCVCLTFSSGDEITLISGTTSIVTPTHSRYSYYTGSTWTTPTDKPPSFRVCSYDAAASLDDVRVVRGNPNLVTTYEGNLSYAYLTDYWDSTSGTIISTGASDPCTDALERDGVVYLAYGANKILTSWTSPSTVATHVVYADKIEIGGGYFWKSYNGEISYTADLSTWTDIDVDDEVIDIRWYDDFLYYITTQGLGRIGYGDAPLMTADVTLSSTAFLHIWQNRLYIANDGYLLEFDQSSIRNISPATTDGGLPPYATGTISALGSTNLYLYACVSATAPYAEGARSGVYAYNGQGWSCLYLFGDNRSVYSMGAQEGVNNGENAITVYTLSDYGLSSGQWSDLSTAPHDAFTIQNNDQIIRGTNASWLETPWLYGGLVMLQKDWESVFVAYDINSPTPDLFWSSTIYWKETEEDAWTLLGTTDFSESGGTAEFRWSNLVTRPSTSKIKIAVQHQPKLDAAMDTASWQNAKMSMNPHLSALRIKYHAMVEDRWQWNLAIPLGEDQELTDGTINTYTFAQQVTHLDSLIVNKVPPFIYKDVDGTQYEVKVMAGNKNLENYQSKGGVTSYNWVYNLTLEMVTTSAYTPPA